MMSMRIDVKQVTKKFRKQKALKDVSFSLEGPKIYGLLGRNGAGKTTFMDISAGLQSVTSGEVLVNGQNPYNNVQVMESICIIKEGDNFHKDMRIIDIFRTCAIIYPNWNGSLAAKLAALYRLPLKKKLKTYSKGMASAVGIIVGLASNA